MKTTGLHIILYVVAGISAFAALVIFKGAKSVMHEIAALLFVSQTTLVICTTVIVQAIREKDVDDETLGCCYRGDNGLKCHVGQLIPDDQYDKAMETCTPLDQGNPTEPDKTVGVEERKKGFY